MVDGVPMSGLVAEVEDPRAVIVAIHGGATSSAYFDCPGHPRLSLLRLAAAQGFTAIALDRPGYGASALYAGRDGGPRPAGVARVRRRGQDPGRRRARRGRVPGRPLGGLRTRSADGGRRARAPTCSAWNSRAPGCATAPRPSRHQGSHRRVTTGRSARSALAARPSCILPEVLTGALSAPGVAYESGVTANWARRDFPDGAARARSRRVQRGRTRERLGVDARGARRHHRVVHCRAARRHQRDGRTADTISASA